MAHKQHDDWVLTPEDIRLGKESALRQERKTFNEAMPKQYQDELLRMLNQNLEIEANWAANQAAGK